MNYSIKGLKVLALSFCGVSIALGTGFSAIAQAQIPGTEIPAEAAQIPQAAPSILDIATVAGAFDTLVAALEAAELVDALSSEGPLTVFAPVDEAFAALPDGVLDALLQPENKDLLTKVLVYHVVEGGVLSSDLSTGEVETLAGDLMVDVSDAGVKVNEAQVLRADVQASNGVIHVIDQVLVPEDVATELASRLEAADAQAAEEQAADGETVETAADDLVLEEAAPVEPAVAEEVPTLLNASEEVEFAEPVSEPVSAPAAAPVRGLW